MEAISSEQRFLEAYEAHADSIFRFCFSKTSNREAALDLMQETFTKMWDYMVKGNEINNMKAFAFTVARNLIKDYYKKKRPVYEHEISNGMPDVADEHESSEWATEAGRLMMLLEHLRDDHREVLVLRFVEGMSVQDIAALLQERENTISVRLNRALKELRSFFEGDK
ncbi:MAG TPA: RNA polymerase sigma factor [Candidatus Paceibacterota bacterium]|jgi:RNA polymerase sigma-70 factor (ECF subfamily)